MSKHWSFEVAKYISVFGCMCIAIFTLALLFIFLANHLVFTGIAILIIWVLATIWYLLGKIKVMGGAA